MSKRWERAQVYYYSLAGIALCVSVLVYLYFNNYFTTLILVHTNYGAVQGFATFTRDGKVFYQFNAVPYSKPPIGKLRFKPPVPVEPWEGVLDATGMTPLCPQYDLVFASQRGVEDCLKINIMTKNPNSNGTLAPVMVFIHGGLFMFGGSGEFYGGRYFLEEDVVFVTINYRLGVLGFLNTRDEVVSGNMGLKDQLEALKFIKRIIPDFGGDPERITLFGESAGGSSVHYHMLNPKSKGYSGAISMSGSSFSPWAFTREPRKQAIRLGNQVGCATGSSHELVNCLMAMDTAELIKPHARLLDIFIDPIDIFGPSVENVSSPEAMSHAFLTDYPTKLAMEGKTRSVPYIAGVTSHEGCFRSAWFIGQKKLLSRLEKDWENLASPAFFLFRNDTPTLDKIWKYYFTSEERRELTLSDYDSLTNLIGDRLFTMPTRDAALLHAKHSGAPTYLYWFTERGDYSLGTFLSVLSDDSWLPRPVLIFFQLVKNFIFRKLDVKTFDLGACHTDELFQMMSFVPTTIMDITAGHRHYEFSKQIVKLWTSFAKDGRPTKIGGVSWERINLRMRDKRSKNESRTGVVPTIPKYLHLNSKGLEMVDEPFHHRIGFWRKLRLPRNLSPELESTYDQDICDVFG